MASEYFQGLFLVCLLPLEMLLRNLRPFLEISSSNFGDEEYVSESIADRYGNELKGPFSLYIS